MGSPASTDSGGTTSRMLAKTGLSADRCVLSAATAASSTGTAIPPDLPQKRAVSGSATMWPMSKPRSAARADTKAALSVANGNHSQ